MGFRSGAYAKIWSIQQVSSTFAKMQISITRKNKSTGEYDTEFSGFVGVVGSVPVNKTLTLKRGDKIKLGEVDVTTKYDKDKNITYTNYKVFSFDTDSDGGSSNAAHVPSVDDGEIEGPALPF